MKYSLLALTIAGALFLTGCYDKNSCSSCAHEDTEQPACSTCPTAEALNATNADMTPDNDETDIMLNK